MAPLSWRHDCQVQEEYVSETMENRSTTKISLIEIFLHHVEPLVVIVPFVGLPPLSSLFVVGKTISCRHVGRLRRHPFYCHCESHLLCTVIQSEQHYEHRLHPWTVFVSVLHESCLESTGMHCRQHYVSTFLFENHVENPLNEKRHKVSILYSNSQTRDME